MTAHIEAKKDDIAKVVIMPEDPKRAEFLAQKYLEDYKCINMVGGILGFTGIFEGKRVTIMASLMGMASIGIYSYELYKFYDVDTIIRVGSAEANDPNLRLYDILLVDESYSDSSFAKVQNGSKENTLTPSAILNDEIIKESLKREIPLTVGRVYSTDVLYSNEKDPKKMFTEYGCLATEMESFALFHYFKLFEKNAACLLTISDHVLKGEQTTSEESEKSFLTMTELALHACKG